MIVVVHDVQERVMMCRLLEKVEKHPEFCAAMDIRDVSRELKKEKLKHVKEQIIVDEK